MTRFTWLLNSWSQARNRLGLLHCLLSADSREMIATAALFRAEPILARAYFPLRRQRGGMQRLIGARATRRFDNPVQSPSRS